MWVGHCRLRDISWGDSIIIYLTELCGRRINEIIIFIELVIAHLLRIRSGSADVHRLKSCGMVVDTSEKVWILLHLINTSDVIIVIIV